MNNHFLKINTNNGEHRWINLDNVTRVSLVTNDIDEPLLVFCFQGQDKVTLHGDNEDTRILIRSIAQTLDLQADSAGMHCAA